MYILKLDLKVYYTNIEAQKIDCSTLKMFELVLASFQVEDKISRAQFFQKSFLLADISAEMVIGMPFLIFRNYA